MGRYIAQTIVKKMAAAGKTLNQSKILIMGATFKENVSDIRNSKVVDLIMELKSFNITVEVVDAFASSKEVEEEYGFSLTPEIGKNYDIIVYAVKHDPYKNLNEAYFQSISTPDCIFVDIKGDFRDKIKTLN